MKLCIHEFILHLHHIEGFFVKIMYEHLQKNHMMLAKQLTQWIQVSITNQFMHKNFIWGSFVSLNIETLKFTKLTIVYSLDS